MELKLENLVIDKKFKLKGFKLLVKKVKLVGFRKLGFFNFFSVSILYLKQKIKVEEVCVRLKYVK